MKKETTNTRIIKWFYNITGPLDEYRRTEIQRIGNNIAIFLTSFLLVLVFVGIIILLGTDSYELAFNIVIGSLLFIIFAVGGYILYETTRYHLNEIEVEETQIPAVKKSIFRQALGISIAFSTIMYLSDILSDWLPAKGPLLPLLTNTSTIGISVAEGVVFGVLMGTTKFLLVKSGNDEKQPTPVQQFFAKKWLILILLLLIISILLSL